MSAWMIALGLSAGYLINKNLTMTARIPENVAVHQSAAKPATDGPPTQEIRKVQRTIPLSDRYQDMNLQDLPKRQADALAQNQDDAHREVAQYEAPVIPEIQGVYLHFDRGV